MSFFGKKSPSAVPAPRSVFGTIGSLFNPNLGATMRPLGETGKMLVTIIAMIFAANGLFPRNHPALLSDNSNVRLTFGEVMRIGWSNVVFSRKTVPQTLIFFAVVLSLGCSVLAIAVGLMALVTGTAHAQGAPPIGPGMFQPPPQDNNDVACGWINWLFNTNTFGCDLQDYLAADGQQLGNLQSTVIQTSLITALAFYSDVILVIAAVVLFYHLTAMIVETAHHGVIMGRRANQVWAPIRLVVAVGLLVPIAAGLNSGQFIVIQIAQWGGAVASNAWAIFLQAVENDPANQLVPPLAPIVRQEVADVILMDACATAYNDIVGNTNLNNGQPNPNQLQIIIPPNPNNNSPDGATKYSYTPTSQGAGVEHQDTDLCGYYIQNAPPQAQAVEAGLTAAIRQAGINAFQQTQNAIQTFAAQSVLQFIPGADGGNLAQPIAPNNQFEQIMVQLYINLQNELTASNIQGYLQQAMQQAVTAASQEGWVSAGAWFNTIARLQGDVTDLAHDFPYKTAPPQVDKIVADNNLQSNTIDVRLKTIMYNYQQWLNDEVNQANNPGGNGLNAEQQQIQLAQLGMEANGGASKTHVMDLIFQAVDYIASRDGVWSPAVTNCVNPGGPTACFSLGVQFTTANPLAEIAAFGHSNLNTAYDVFDDYLVVMGLVSGVKDASGLGAIFSGTGRFSLSNILGKVFGAGASATADGIGPIGDVIGMIVVVFFTAGFMLAFFLPLIPFYRFMFGTLSWFLSLIEAIIAVPLIALAHLTPEGEGFMGDKAKGAYYFIFNLFLRPTLMVFGLIAGYILFCIAASLMNLLYTTAVAAAGGIGNGHYTLARIVYSIIYVVILYLSCNKCFQLIDWLPEHCIKWMGAQGLHHAQMGNPEEIGGYMGLASGYVEQKIVSGAGAAMKGPAGALMLGEMNANPATRGAVQNSLANIGSVAGSTAQEIATAGVNLETTAAQGVNKVAGNIGSIFKSPEEMANPKSITGGSGSGGGTPPASAH